MIQNNISKYILNNSFLIIVLLLLSNGLSAQEKSEDEVIPEETIVASDTIPYKYGIRIGVDISGPISMLIYDEKELYKGSFDIRIHKMYFIAGELGYQKQIYDTENLKYTTEGVFMTIGADYDFLGYTVGRNDAFIFGIRYGIAQFNQTVDQYKIQNGYWNDDAYIGNINSLNATAHWINIRTGLKVELLHNFYLGASVGVNLLFNDTKLDNFSNLYIPGYGKNRNNKSWVFNYTLMYLLPFN